MYLFCAFAPPPRLSYGPHSALPPSLIPEFYDRFAGRQALLEFAAKSGIPVAQTTAKPWSTDENLFHISYEAGILEDPDTTPPSDMWKLTKSIEEAPSTPERIALHFVEGVPSKLEIFSDEAGKNVSDTITNAVDIFFALNKLARKHGIGRIDIVENRFIGVKSRGCYESPGATILRKAHMDLEGLVLDRNVRALRDGFVTTELSKILYNGYWFSPEREFVQSCLASSQKNVNGKVRIALLKGNVIVEGRSSDTAVSFLFTFTSACLLQH
jgi:argininosuccinate synthase